jgi:DNA-binding NarL/FixJ family response regulator
LLEMHPGWERCAEADSGEEAIRVAEECKPDAIIMDVSMPGIGGLRATKIICEASPTARVVLLTFHKSTELVRAGLSAGALGYVLKSDSEPELIEALETVTRGGTYITRSISSSAVAKIVDEIKQTRSVAKAGAKVGSSQS